MRLSLPSWRPVCLIWEAPGLKIKSWLIVTQLEEFIEVIGNTEAHYISGDVVEKAGFLHEHTASQGQKICKSHARNNRGWIKDSKSDATTSSAAAELCLKPDDFSSCFLASNIYCQMISCLKLMAD